MNVIGVICVEFYEPYGRHVLADKERFSVVTKRVACSFGEWIGFCFAMGERYDVLSLYERSINGYRPGSTGRFLCCI
jgi:hypothetical protein